MAVIADCPGCQSGEHDKHVEHWGTRPEGIIDGEFCHCPGDCAERVKAAFDQLFGGTLTRLTARALSPEAQQLYNDLHSTDPAVHQVAVDKLNALLADDPL